MKKYLGIIVLFIAFQNNCLAQQFYEGGTTVIGYIENNRAFIAADSKQLQVNNETHDTTGLTICKVGHVGNICYGFSGNLRFLNKNEETFNVYKILNNAFSQNLDYEKSISLFNTELVKQFNYAISFIPSYKYDTTMPLLSLLLASFKNDKPFIASYVYNFRHNELNQIIFNCKTESNKAFNDTGKVFFHIGYAEQIKNYVKENPGFFYNKKTVEMKFRKLFQVEIEKNSKYVDWPIDMLEVKRNGYTWILQNQECR